MSENRLNCRTGRSLQAAAVCMGLNSWQLQEANASEHMFSSLLRQENHAVTRLLSGRCQPCSCERVQCNVKIHEMTYGQISYILLIERSV